MDHVIDDCPIYKTPHGASGLREIDDETISWLNKDLPI